MSKEHNDPSSSAYNSLVAVVPGEMEGAVVQSRVAACAAVAGLYRLPSTTPVPWPGQRSSLLGHRNATKISSVRSAPTQPPFPRVAGLSGQLSPPAGWPRGDTRCCEPPRSCSFSADPNPHHIHPPPTATEAQEVSPSLASDCFTSHNLEMLNKIAASSQTHYKNRKGARKGWVWCVFQGV